MAPLVSVVSEPLSHAAGAGAELDDDVLSAGAHAAAAASPTTANTETRNETLRMAGIIARAGHSAPTIGSRCLARRAAKGSGCPGTRHQIGRPAATGEHLDLTERHRPRPCPGSRGAPRHVWSEQESGRRPQRMAI